MSDSQYTLDTSRFCVVLVSTDIWKSKQYSIWGYQDNFKPIYFFYENILSVKKHQNAKQTTFTLLKVFVHAKTCCLFFVCFVFVLLVGFCLIYILVCSRLFRKKNKLTWHCPDNLIYYTTDVIKNLFVGTSFYLWSSVRIYFF